MDHISKALQKAEKEQQSVRSWVQPSSVKSTPAYAEPTAGQTIELDANLLQKHHILSGLGHEDPKIADKYRLLRTRVLQIMKPRSWSTLGITSASPKAGKSLTAINLAITMAQDPERKVILVDADLRKPSISSDLGFDVDCGLIDYLTSTVELADIIKHPKNIPNLTILPGHRPHEQSDVTPELLNSAKMRELMQNLNAYDPSTIIIVDLPPVLIGDDVIVQASHLQSILMVIEEGGTNIDELIECAELLTDLNLLGTVLNKSDQPAKTFEGYYQMNSKH